MAEGPGRDFAPEAEAAHTDPFRIDDSALRQQIDRGAHRLHALFVSRFSDRAARHRIDAERSNPVRGERAQRPLVANAAAQISCASIVGDEERQPPGDLRADQYARRTAAAHLPRDGFGKEPFAVRIWIGGGNDSLAAALAEPDEARRDFGRCFDAEDGGLHYGAWKKMGATARELSVRCSEAGQPCFASRPDEQGLVEVRVMERDDRASVALAYPPGEALLAGRALAFCGTHAAGFERGAQRDRQVGWQKEGGMRLRFEERLTGGIGGDGFGRPDIVAKEVARCGG